MQFAAPQTICQTTCLSWLFDVSLADYRIHQIKHINETCGGWAQSRARSRTQFLQVYELFSATARHWLSQL